MSSSQDYNSAYIPGSQSIPRTSTIKRINRKLDTDEVSSGYVFLLPPKEELPEHAVKRVRGKGPIEEGIYNHPIVVVSRPAEQDDIVHFQIVRV